MESANKIIIIIPVKDNLEFLKQNLLDLKKISGADTLVVDDGSVDSTCEFIKDTHWIRYIKHEMPLGLGGSLISGLEYACCYDYETVITIDPENLEFISDISMMLGNMDYGYDIVNCSRILENYDHSSIPKEIIDMTSSLSSSLRDITDMDITDPFSGIRAYRIESIKEMNLTEFTAGIHLQIWIQASYLGLNVIEIPSMSGKSFGKEFSEIDDPLGFSLSLMESEKYLYKNSNMN